MDSVKTAFFLTGGTLVILLILMGLIKRPEQKLYEEVMETVMVNEGLTSKGEVMAYFPELEDIQLKMERMGRLKSSIHGLTGGPAPDVSENLSAEIDKMSEEIQDLQMDIEKELTDILAEYSMKQSLDLAENN